MFNDKPVTKRSLGLWHLLILWNIRRKSRNSAD